MFSCFNACRIRTKLGPAQCIKEVNKLKVKGRCSPKVDGITFRLCSSRCEKVRDWGVDRATAGCEFVSSTRPSPPTQKPTGDPTMSPTVSPTTSPTCISGEYPPTSVGTRGCYPREQCTESYASKYCANLLCIPQGMNGECSGAISRLNGWGASL